MKNKIRKLQSYLEISRNVDNKLVYQFRRLEHMWWENEQYSRRECIEICRIPQSRFEARHRLKSDNNGRSNKVNVKFSKCKYMVPVMNKVLEKC